MLDWEQCKHCLERTRVISMHLEECAMAKNYTKEFWKHQHDIDPERRIHSMELYWIWNEKTNFLKRAIDLNPFDSDFFAWVDIGYFRTAEFTDLTMLRHIPKKLKENQVLMLDVTRIVPIDMTAGVDIYLGGGFIGGYITGLLRWSEMYYEVLHQNRHSFIGKDQPWMARTCVENPSLCLLIEPRTGFGDKWFFMSAYMHGVFGSDTGAGQS